MYGVVTNPTANPGRQEAYRKQLWASRQGGGIADDPLTPDIDESQLA